MFATPATAKPARSHPLPPCCLPGGTSAASFLEAVESRPSALLALAAALLLALGPSPVAAPEMTTLCTADGLKQVPVDGNSSPDTGPTGCAHACLPRDRRRG